jgi:CheY-like chemotaxis protein
MNLHTGAQQKGKILCVDDDLGLREMLEVLLKTAGYETIIARDGEEGLALFKQHSQELVAVVLDLRMPGLDGMAVARMIRKGNTDIPLIALSAYLGGHDRDDVLKDCEAAGFNAYTKKPFSPETFLRALNEWVQKYRSMHSGT